MIPEIGIVIAAYVITRMVDLFNTQIALLDEPATHRFRSAVAILTIVLLLVTIAVAGFVGFDLVVRAVTGINPTADLPR